MGLMRQVQEMPKIYKIYATYIHQQNPSNGTMLICLPPQFNFITNGITERETRRRINVPASCEEIDNPNVHGIVPTEKTKYLDQVLLQNHPSERHLLGHLGCRGSRNSRFSFPPYGSFSKKIPLEGDSFAQAEIPPHSTLVSP